MKGTAVSEDTGPQILCIGASVLLAIGYMLGPGQDTVP